MTLNELKSCQYKAELQKIQASITQLPVNASYCEYGIGHEKVDSNSKV